MAGQNTKRVAATDPAVRPIVRRTKPVKVSKKAKTPVRKKSKPKKFRFHLYTFLGYTGAGKPVLRPGDQVTTSTGATSRPPSRLGQVSDGAFAGGLVFRILPNLSFGRGGYFKGNLGVGLWYSNQFTGLEGGPHYDYLRGGTNTNGEYELSLDPRGEGNQAGMLLEADLNLGYNFKRKHIFNLNVAGDWGYNFMSKSYGFINPSKVYPDIFPAYFRTGLNWQAHLKDGIYSDLDVAYKYNNIVTGGDSVTTGFGLISVDSYKNLSHFVKMRLGIEAPTQVRNLPFRSAALGVDGSKPLFLDASLQGIITYRLNKVLMFLSAAGGMKIGVHNMEKNVPETVTLDFGPDGGTVDFSNPVRNQSFGPVYGGLSALAGITVNRFLISAYLHFLQNVELGKPTVSTGLRAEVQF